MDTAQIETTVTFLAAVVHAVEHTAIVVSLIVAGYCAAMHAGAFLFTLVRPILAFARECTVHMLTKLVPLVAELQAWPKDIRAALQSRPPKPTVPPNQPHSP
jgi:predicted membrane-bound spermidine synthase